MPPSVQSNLIDVGSIAVAERRSQRSWMGHAQPLQLMNMKTSKKEFPQFILRDTLDAPSTRSKITFT